MKPQKIDPSQMNVPRYQEAYQDDEIDLRELMKVIWGYKWLTVIMCALAIIGSVFYALNAQQWWVAKGKVIEPQLSNVAIFYSQKEHVKAVLSLGGIGIPGGFSSLFTPNSLFSSFITEFNASINKQAFLEENTVFKSFLQQHDIKMPTQATTAENQAIAAAYRSTLNAWLIGITALKNAENGELSLSFRSDGKENSALLLNQYIDFVSLRVKQNQLKQFSLFISEFENKLQILISMEEANAELELFVLLEKTEYAYQIAAGSNLNQFQPNQNVAQELFQISLGSKILQSKVKVLKSMKDLNILNPRIGKMKITLEALKILNMPLLAADQTFSPYRYLQNVEAPLNRAAPKRALIVILATLLAGMLSIFIALVHYFLIKKEN